MPFIFSGSVMSPEILNQELDEDAPFTRVYNWPDETKGETTQTMPLFLTTKEVQINKNESK